jgi:hypothetical protein
MTSEPNEKAILPRRALSPEDHYEQFQKHKGRRPTSLSDLDWAEVESFLETIPTEIERVGFLSVLARLPDDGISNDIIVDPPRHRRNHDLFLMPLRKERSRLLSRHFSLDHILNQAERITDHGEALSYLWQVLSDYGKYHPSTRQNCYQPDELAFCNAIKTEIQRRKDMLNSIPASNVSIGEIVMGDSYKVGQAGAVGPNAHGHDITFNQVWTELQATMDVTKLAEELSTLRQQMRKVALEPAQDIAISEIARAEQSVKAGDGSKTVAYLKSAGKWALDVATKIGTSLAAEAIKKSMES